ncbi:hypothetical protein EG328_009924 [Venturia inaequalis]|uniref:Cell wall proline rich protein n=1 Tax=Venturia inaequalis TaxID=5025 RepID=A0A8H3UYF9_VENIN|nr:hypothetical protein EG328_009924 [Venturia inaequalis]KAE9977923.1 hypothetical protein EG327_007548 [Venturia inaequalis]
MMAFHQSSQSLGLLPPSICERRGLQETGPVELMPNPDFVFPARSAEPSPTMDNWNALNRPGRPQSSHRPRNSMGDRRRQQSRGSVALPNFSFNPSTSASTGTGVPIVTPPLSPNPPSPTSPSRPVGHKRSGSEYIGNDKTGTLMSTSPTKGECMSSPQPAQLLGPPAGRPRHAHTRSKGLSQHDLQSIMQPRDAIPAVPQLRSESAPATPLEANQRPFFPSSPRRPSLAAERSISSPDQAISSSSVDSSPQRYGAVPRVRVGFADRVEYIRPLSTISSETEGSFSTIRGHSVNNSMSSVISAGTSSSPSTRMKTPSLNTTFEDEIAKPRPQSSGDILDLMTSGKEAFGPRWTVDNRPKSAIDSPTIPDSTVVPKASKRKSPSWWETRRQQTHALRSSVSEPSLLPSPPVSPCSVQESDHSSVSDEVAPADGGKSSRKPRKVKSWAHSLISRTSKSNGNLKTKPTREQESSPPTSSYSNDTTITSPTATVFHFQQPVPVETVFEPNFDIDETVTIVTDAPATAAPQWKPRDSSESDSMSPVIDLDAALGPFNTPALGANNRLNARGPPRVRRSMHSLNGFSSSQNHRRSESAPELVPFELRNAKVAPAAVMPDVFEEEDEEEAAVDMASSPALDGGFVHVMDEVPKADNKLVDESTVEKSAVIVAAPLSTMVDTQEGDSTPDRLSRSSTLRLSMPMALPLRNISPSQSSPIEVVEDFEEPRASSLTQDSDSTITPPLIPQDDKNAQPIISLSLQQPHHTVMTPDTFSSSSFSSNGYNNSQASLSSPRLDTATSSSTDPRSFPFGEPGPVGMSVDDVPSLSSSRSTMTTPPTNPFVGASPFNPPGRSSSVYSLSSLEERRKYKRASVASLSRLMGSFGEKSKLSIESRPQSQHVMSTTPKVKKANRLSKLIFWKKSNGEKERAKSDALMR